MTAMHWRQSRFRHRHRYVTDTGTKQNPGHAWWGRGRLRAAHTDSDLEEASVREGLSLFHEHKPRCFQALIPGYFFTVHSGSVHTHIYIYTQTHTCTHTMDWTDRIRDSRYILSVSFFSSLTPSLSWACKALIIHKVSSWLHIAVADTGSLSLHLFFLFFFCFLGRANRLGSHTDSNLQAHKRHSSMLRIIVFPFIISLF